MSRIPGTTFHDEDPPKPDVELLQLRQRFYESIMSYPAHNGPRCKIAEANGLTCCNPKCNGHWGTGCWCCHSLSFAEEAEPEVMRLHLDLKPYEKPVSGERQIDVRRLIETMSTCNAGDGWKVEKLTSSEQVPGGPNFVMFKDSKGQVQLIMPRAIYEDWLKA